MSTLRIVESIIKDQNTVLPVAHVLGDDYGDMADSCISLPCVVNSDGIGKVLKISMTDAEQQQMVHSADTLKAFIKDVCSKN